MILPVLLAGFSVPAQAEVRSVSDNGFNSFHSAEVSATPAVIWKRLTTPKDWWNPAHSWSQSTAGFYMDSKAGGCFCELIQEKNAAGKTVTVGSVEHMRIIFYQPGKVLRMQGGLGPLQGEAVTGTLTVAMEALKDKEGSSRVSFSYSVGGYMRQKVSSLSAGVDAVMGEQFKRMIEPFVTTGAADKKDWSLDVDGIVGEKTDAAPQADTPSDAATENAGEPIATEASPPVKGGKPKVVIKDMLDDKPAPSTSDATDEEPR